MILQKQREIRADTHCCLLFPTYASRDAVSGMWRLPVFGGVYELGEVRLRKRVLLNLLQKIMRVDPAIMQGDRFHERILPFVSAGERGLGLEVRVGGDGYRIRRKTRRNGLFHGVVRIADSSVRRASEGGPSFDAAVGVPGESDLAANKVRLVDRQGLSIVSDIDDTIKITGVGRREELLANTFLREFRSVEGMAPVYRRWAEQGAVFHYVSSSPWQLFQPLSEMTTASGFPSGSLHLRAFRLRDHMLRRLLLIHRRGKRVEIGGLLKAFPQRRLRPDWRFG